jgi:hypothetical protein
MAMRFPVNVATLIGAQGVIHVHRSTVDFGCCDPRHQG